MNGYTTVHGVESVEIRDITDLGGTFTRVFQFKKGPGEVFEFTAFASSKEALEIEVLVKQKV